METQFGLLCVLPIAQLRI